LASSQRFIDAATKGQIVNGRVLDDTVFKGINRGTARLLLDRERWRQSLS